MAKLLCNTVKHNSAVEGTKLHRGSERWICSSHHTTQPKTTENQVMIQLVLCIYVSRCTRVRCVIVANTMSEIESPATYKALFLRVMSPMLRKCSRVALYVAKFTSMFL